MTNMMGETTCPACGETFVLDDGKDERKYRNHLEGHIEEFKESVEELRDSVVVDMSREIQTKNAALVEAADELKEVIDNE